MVDSLCMLRAKMFFFLMLLAAVLLGVDELIRALYSTGRRHVRAMESEKAAWDPRELSTLYV